MPCLPSGTSRKLIFDLKLCTEKGINENASLDLFVVPIVRYGQGEIAHIRYRTGLKFVLEPFLSLDSDNLRREHEPKVAYIFPGK
jgi:hypothetical protein